MNPLLVPSVREGRLTTAVQYSPHFEHYAFLGFNDSSSLVVDLRKTDQPLRSLRRTIGGAVEKIGVLCYGELFVTQHDDGCLRRRDPKEPGNEEIWEIPGSGVVNTFLDVQKGPEHFWTIATHQFIYGINFPPLPSVRKINRKMPIIPEAKELDLNLLKKMEVNGQVDKGINGAIFSAVYGSESVLIKSSEIPLIAHFIKYEANILSYLSKIPGVLKILGVVKFPNQNVGMIMEHSGGSLRKWLGIKKFLDFPKLKKVALDLSSVLHKLHEARVIHMDLKPENILLKKNKRNFSVTLIDFGLSVIEGLPSDLKKQQTPFDATTPFYAAPELLQRTPRKDYAADIYALGVVLWECFSGLTFKEYKELFLLDLEDFRQQVLHGYRPAIPDHCPVFVRELIQQCWHADPSLRPTAQQVYRAIKSWPDPTQNPPIPKELLPEAVLAPQAPLPDQRLACDALMTLFQHPLVQTPPPPLEKRAPLSPISPNTPKRKKPKTEESTQEASNLPLNPPGLG